MSGSIAIFVKTPGYSPLKTRLAQTLGKIKAEEFYLLSVKAVEATAFELSKHIAITPYWAIAEEKGMDAVIWQNLARLYAGNGSLGELLHKVYSKLLSQHDYVILIGADAPQLSVNLLSSAIRFLNTTNDFVIGPTQDGGFYLFAGNKPIAKEVWTQTPYSEARTSEILTDLLEAHSKVSFLQKLTDVDTEGDLSQLAQELVGEKLPEQQEVSNWLRMKP